MKIYIIYCVPTEIPYLGKFLFLKYGPKCSQPIRLQDFLINHISRTDISLHVDTDSHKSKVDQKHFWVGMVKNGFGQSGHRTIKLVVSQE